MAVARINREVEVARVELAREERESRIIPVCAATQVEWREYLDSENQALKSKWMEWIDGTVYIVEMPSQEHERFTREAEHVLRNQCGFDAYLKTHGSAVIPDHPDLPDYEADNSYGPRSFMGAPHPPGVQAYASWYTLVVEVGAWRRWGHNAGMLDWKAREWSRFPGLRFILCVKVGDRLASAEYKLYRVERDHWGQVLPLTDLDPVPVVGPQAVVTFDSRELLGLPPASSIPASPYSDTGFPDPTFTVDLLEALEMARRT